jgi:hypothetical protein
MQRTAAAIVACALAQAPAHAAGPPTGDPAEPAMDAYADCLDQRLLRLKESCEPATVVAQAIMAGCVVEEGRLETAISPAFRVYEEMKLGMLGIRRAQTDRVLARLVEYRIANPCPGR